MSPNVRLLQSKAALEHQLVEDYRAVNNQEEDKAIRDAMSGYGNVRSKVIQAHRKGDALAGLVKKEYPTVQLN